MKLNIAVLPRDGIGPEIIGQALRVTEAVCEKFGFEPSKMKVKKKRVISWIRVMFTKRKRCRKVLADAKKNCHWLPLKQWQLNEKLFLII